MIGYDELLKKRRAVRHFDQRDVPERVISEIIDEVCMAPSAGNGQPWRFVIIRSREMIRRLSDESKAAFIEDIEKYPDAGVKKYEELLRFPDFNVFYNAPCLVLITGESSVRSLYVDCALAAAYFMFSAAARGLGTCWVDLGGNIHNPKTRKELGLTPAHRIVAPIIIGYPTLVPEMSKREPAKILKQIE